MDTLKRNKRHDVLGNSNNMGTKLDPYQYAINLFKLCAIYLIYQISFQYWNLRSSEHQKFDGQSIKNQIKSMLKYVVSSDVKRDEMTFS